MIASRIAVRSALYGTCGTAHTVIWCSVNYEMSNGATMTSSFVSGVSGVFLRLSAAFQHGLNVASV